MQDKDKYMTTKEAVSFTGKSINTIRRAIKKGTLVSKLVNGKRFILISSVVSAYGLTQEVATQEVATQEVATQEVATQKPLTHDAPTHDAPKRESPNQEVATQSTPSQEVATEEVVTQEVATQKPTQELLTQGHDQQLAEDVLAYDHNAAYPLRYLIEILRAELRAKDEQLRAKDEQIAQLMHVLQSTMELIKQLPAATEPSPEPSPEPAPEPTPEAPKGKGFWATVRKRFRR